MYDELFCVYSLLFSVLRPSVFLCQQTYDHKKKINIEGEEMEYTPDKFKDAIIMGAEWLSGRAQIHTQEEKLRDLPIESFNKSFEYPFRTYVGGMKTEYNSKNRRWRTLGTTWHTGLAIRALLKAYQISQDDGFLKSAVLGGEFIRKNQILDPENKKRHGMILSYEDRVEWINVSAMLECLAELLDLYDLLKEERWLTTVKLAVDWVYKNAYLKEGLVLDACYPETGKFEYADPWGGRRGYARPLIEDAVFYLAYQRFEDKRYLEAFKSIADRLLEDEFPPGNWMTYIPCSTRGRGHFHPRQAWWWGYALLQAYDAFKDERYLETAVRAADWYLNHQNLDGGFYYHTSLDGSHRSFDFCTSASACAVIFWLDLWERLRLKKYLKASKLSLNFVLNAQFRGEVSDPNLKGAFFENLDTPDGTDMLRVNLRDISTSLAIQALHKASSIKEISTKTV